MYNWSFFALTHGEESLEYFFSWRRKVMPAPFYGGSTSQNSNWGSWSMKNNTGLTSGGVGTCEIVSGSLSGNDDRAGLALWTNIQCESEMDSSQSRGWISLIRSGDLSFTLLACSCQEGPFIKITVEKQFFWHYQKARTTGLGF